ncbi:MAG: 16S rRNA (cytosine(967)-C(5))-methyltransferase RsmB [Deltaproteobacteria bacterium]|nr:16S rRNA (cytosine(967)-C(5))-methyltransferase RsmB [Deltaproteobacteria bacterium]MBN2686808.1 16S rRNA (cytosine(967)-C(5))-methyltransferase RsmB [Deltaproteobacteria bacterium]
MMKKSPRGAAVTILNRVEQTGAYAEPLLDSFLSSDTVATIQDRRLLTRLVYGTLRMKNNLDWIIRSLYRGKPSSLQQGVCTILRVALYQLIYMERIPAFAAVDEAVKLAKQMYPGRDRLVNAILRNALRKMDAIPYPEEDHDLSRYISIVYSHPEWMTTRWIGRFGPDETKALCEGNNGIPPITIRCNVLKESRDDIIEKLQAGGNRAMATQYSTSGILIADLSVPLARMPLFQQGYIQVQDEASQLISHIVDPREGEVILDICSGAGIKSTHMGEIMNNRGRIIAVDVNPAKKAAAQRLSQRMGVTIIEPVTKDSADDLGADYHGIFDRVLVDAPCSGIGTVRRHPEIKWRIGEADMRKNAILQKNILRAAAPYPKRGGVIVYSTCSTEPEENEEVIRDFLTRNGDYGLVEPPETIDRGMVTTEGFFRTYPHRHGTDGFFAAVLLRS